MKLRWPTLFLCSAVAVGCFAGRAASQDVDARVERLYQEARNEQKQGRDDVAIQKYQEIIRLTPNLPAAYNNLGRLYFRQNRMEEAVRTLKHALELDAKLASARALLGFAYYQMGDFQNARQALAAALQLNPGDRKASLCLAHSLFQLEDYNGALRRRLRGALSEGRRKPTNETL